MAHHLRPSVRRRARSESGSIIILTALSMVLMLGIAAFAIDASFLYTERNRMAAAADAGAKSAAVELYRRGGAILNTDPLLTTFAQHEAQAQGFDLADTTVTAGPPTAPSAFVGNANFVQVSVSRATTTFFASVVNAAWASVTPVARAVAGVSSGPNCIVILGTSNNAFSVGNGTTMTMTGCGIADAGGADLKPNAVVNSSGVSISVGACPSATSMPNCVANSPPPSDPLATLPFPAQPANGILSIGTNNCPARNVIPSGGVTINPGTYCGLRFNNSSGPLTMNPGEYYLTGPIDVQNASATVNWTGAGVTIFLASLNGAVDLNTNFITSLNLSAQTSGPYKGILFYQQRGNTNAATFSKNNSTAIALSGALYFPDANVSIKNNNGNVTNDCTLIIAKSLSFDNNSTLTNTCSAYGGSPFQTVSLAE